MNCLEFVKKFLIFSKYYELGCQKGAMHPLYTIY